ncbi:MAG: hypothetical protein FJX52_07005 [Alphaproteobacteria bacterium]|nr:hypothetical protein [Alphaproteobacteria bacterium]
MGTPFFGNGKFHRGYDPGNGSALFCGAHNADSWAICQVRHGIAARRRTAARFKLANCLFADLAARFAEMFFRHVDERQRIPMAAQPPSKQPTPESVDQVP